jgi:hypothetical protein
MPQLRYQRKYGGNVASPYGIFTRHVSSSPALMVKLFLETVLRQGLSQLQADHVGVLSRGIPKRMERADGTREADPS